MSRDGSGCIPGHMLWAPLRCVHARTRTSAHTRAHTRPPPTRTLTHTSLLMCAQVLMSLVFKTWRSMAAAAAVLNTAFLVLVQLIPESARWLLVQGRRDAALKVCA